MTEFFDKPWRNGNISIILLFVLSCFCPTAAYLQTAVPKQVLNIFDNSCAQAGCHVGPLPAGELNLTGGAVNSDLINVRSSGKPKYIRVVPGSPEKSYLLAKLVGSRGIVGERMPTGGKELSKAELRSIFSWIKSMPATATKKRAIGNSNGIDNRKEETNNYRLSSDIIRPRKKDPKAFPGWSIPNLPTTETVPKGGFMYRIGHKFAGAVSEGIDNFFGLDNGAFMMMQVAFPVTNDMSISIQRSAEDATYEVASKYRIFNETGGGAPFSAAIHGGVDWSSTAIIPDPENINENSGRLDAQRFAYFFQLPISKSLGNSSLLVTPSILLNGNARLAGESPLITIGLAGRYSLSRKYGVFVEYIPILSGFGDAATVGAFRSGNGALLAFESLTAGFEIFLGGHVFHFFVTNTAGNTTNQYLSGGNFDFLGGDLRIGFNIFRTLNYPF